MKTFIVAEIGTNHMGDFEKGQSLVVDAALAGANAVKTQLYTAERLAAVDSPLYWEGRGSQREAFQKLDTLPLEEHCELLAYARALGMHAFSTPFDLDAVDTLYKWGVTMMKIASADITYFDLLAAVAQTRLPVLLSTGASTMEEVYDAVEIMMNAGMEAHKLTLMGCTLTYPCPDKDVNLGQIYSLRKIGLRVGYSDHTTSVVIPGMAVIAGATVIEKHLGDHSFNGADNAWALDREQFAAMVSVIKGAEIVRGGVKEVLPSEESARLYARRSLATKRDVRKGELITRETVTALRPGTGMHPGEFANIEFRVFASTLAEGTILTTEHII